MNINNYIRKVRKMKFYIKYHYNINLYQELVNEIKLLMNKIISLSQVNFIMMDLSNNC